MATEVQRLVARFVGEDAGLSRELGRVARSASEAVASLVEVERASRAEAAARKAAADAASAMRGGASRTQAAQVARDNALIRQLNESYEAGVLTQYQYMEAVNAVVDAIHRGEDGMSAYRILQAQIAADERIAIQVEQQHISVLEQLRQKRESILRSANRGRLSPEQARAGLHGVNVEEVQASNVHGVVQRQMRGLGRSLPEAEARAFQARYNALMREVKAGTIGVNEAKRELLRLGLAIKDAERKAQKAAEAEKRRTQLRRQATSIISKYTTATERLAKEQQVLDRAYKAGLIGPKEYLRTLQRLKVATEQSRKHGIGLRSEFKRLNLPITQAGFAIDDFVTVIGMPGQGLSAAIRSASNNISQMIALFAGGTLLGAVGAVGTSFLQFTPALFRWAFGMKDIAEETKRAEKALTSFEEVLQKVGERMRENLALAKVVAEIQKAETFSEGLQVATRAKEGAEDQLEIIKKQIEAGKQFGAIHGQDVFKNLLEIDQNSIRSIEDAITLEDKLTQRVGAIRKEWEKIPPFFVLQLTEEQTEMGSLRKRIPLIREFIRTMRANLIPAREEEIKTIRKRAEIDEAARQKELVSLRKIRRAINQFRAGGVGAPTVSDIEKLVEGFEFAPRIVGFVNRLQAVRDFLEQNRTAAQKLRDKLQEAFSLRRFAQTREQWQAFNRIIDKTREKLGEVQGKEQEALMKRAQSYKDQIYPLDKLFRIRKELADLESKGLITEEERFRISRENDPRYKKAQSIIEQFETPLQKYKKRLDEIREAKPYLPMEILKKATEEAYNDFQKTTGAVNRMKNALAGIGGVRAGSAEAEKLRAAALLGFAERARRPKRISKRSQRQSIGGDGASVLLGNDRSAATRKQNPIRILQRMDGKLPDKPLFIAAADIGGKPGK